MNINISQIIADLQPVRKLLEQFVLTQTMSVSDGNKCLTFFSHYQKTNDIVYYALDVIRQERKETLSEFTQLLQATNEILDFLNENEGSLQALDFQDITQCYIKPYEDDYNTAIKESSESWKEYQKISNRLDYIDERDDEFNSLQKELEEKETQYNILRARVYEVHTLLQSKQSEICALYYFTLDMLIAVIFKMRDISQSVIADLEKAGKGECS